MVGLNDAASTVCEQLAVFMSQAHGARLVVMAGVPQSSYLDLRLA